MRWTLAGSILFAAGCAATQRVPNEPEAEPVAPPLPWEQAPGAPLTLPRASASGPVALVGGTVMTATGDAIEEGVVVMRSGRIEAVGPRADIVVPTDAKVIDVAGRFVTPGIIDTHSHMGVYPVPNLAAHGDGNEATSPVTAEVRAADGFWPQDPALSRALAAGVTTIQVLPGSANLVGGRGAIMKLKPGRSASEMVFPDAPATLKMACGENPKRVYGERKAAPSTRMGSVAGYRAAFQKAFEYGRGYREWQERARLWQGKRSGFDKASERKKAGTASDEEAKTEDPGPAPLPPPRDFALETLLGVIEGKVLVQFHCYRADEIVRLMELAREFGFKVRSVHHGVEAYKVRDLLASEGVAVSTWADWWGFKIEAFDMVRENLALLTEAGVRGVVHSDDPMLVQRLPQEAAKAMHAGRARGIDITPVQALRWLTLNPAWVLGIDAETGSLERGKMADVVVWSRSPFSVYGLADLVFVDGELLFDRADGPNGRKSDFEVGLSPSVP